MKHANVAVFVPHNGCPHQCSFCDQRAITGETLQPTGEDVRRIAQAASEELRKSGRVAELAFFGGSFTAIARDYMEELLQSAAPFVKNGTFTGIRASTRPDAVSEDRLALCRQYGVTAIELGAQSMSDEVLRRNGRGHTAQDVRDAAKKIREAGISLGLQMMTGLYGDTPEGAYATARALIALRPDTVRIYPAIVMRGTLLAQWYEAGCYRPQTLPEAVALCAGLLECFTQAGISVIRVGLHSTPELLKNRVAGPYHPAFRELCESRIFRNRMETLLREVAPGAVTMEVHPRDLSKAIGQRGENRAYFQTMGYSVQFLQNDTLRMGECAIHQQERR